MYTKEMLESIKKVEANHSQNSTGTISAMSQRKPSIFLSAQKRRISSIFVQVSGVGLK